MTSFVLTEQFAVHQDGVSASQLIGGIHNDANVGGAAGRHPFGSVDVRFKTKNGQAKAHKELCKSRKLGRLRALGFYPGTGLHFGMGDKVANTWGKSCS